jgi:choline dehydrogenase-like flavoprotein
MIAPTQYHANPANNYDYDAAASEGWFISEASGNPDGTKWRFERRDESAKFSGDPMAHKFVIDRAGEGSQNHIDVLAWLEANEPKEFEIVMSNANAIDILKV